MSLAFNFIKYEDENSYELLIDFNLMNLNDDFIKKYCHESAKEFKFYFSNCDLFKAIEYIESKLYYFNPELFENKENLSYIKKEIDALKDTLNSILELLQKENVKQ
jgi:hypothetical protein